MILEVGAGGCIMVTPPAKGSPLEKAMTGEKIGGVTVSSLSLANADESPEYARYMADVHKLNELGQLQRDVNGNWIFLHRAGDLMLDAKGDPILFPIKPTVYNSAPRVDFTGIRDSGLSRPCGRRHLDDIRSMDIKSFNQLYDEITQEARRRLLGGEPITYEDNPHAVASI